MDCKLSGGTETTCIPTKAIAEPLSYTPGPWCSVNISDGPDKSGICLEGGEAFAVDGANFAEYSHLLRRLQLAGV
jgi:hypothetical protein